MTNAVEAAGPGSDLGEHFLVGQEEVECELPLQLLLQQREVGRTDGAQLGVTFVVSVGLRGIVKSVQFKVV